MSCSDLCPLPTALLPSMIRRRQGHVVTISSIQGKISVPFRSACEYFLLPTFPLVFSPYYKNNTFTVQNSDVRETLSTERAGTKSVCAPEQRPGLSPSSAPRATCDLVPWPPCCAPRVLAPLSATTVGPQVLPCHHFTACASRILLHGIKCAKLGHVVRSSVVRLFHLTAYLSASAHMDLPSSLSGYTVIDRMDVV